MNIQIFGTKSCNDTKKAERYFKERRIQFHFRDLNEKGLAKGEMENITRVITIEELIDKEGKHGAHAHYQSAGKAFDEPDFALRHARPEVAGRHDCQERADKDSKVLY